MPNWTKEQKEAIEKEGCNIIVSAGAGSGKTAVLTERVIRKLKAGININQILVLTFTNAAAFGMKERIRKAIKKEPNLKEQLDLIDGAYITTFDSFSLSIVKKYHYLLNVSRDVTIIDNSIIYNEKIKIIDDIFEREYKEKNAKFIKLISDLCIKDDSDIKSYILKINDKMDMLMDKQDYLENYKDKYFTNEFIEKTIDDYQKKINEKFNKIKEIIKNLLDVVETGGNFYDKALELETTYNNALSYEDIYNALYKKLPTLPKNSEDDVKSLKENLSDAISNLKKYMELETLDQVRESIELTKDYCEVFVNIIKELHTRIMQFKYKNNSFEFNDIAHMAIKVVRDNENIRLSLKNFFKEIMIDEYQDTSYLQESFINLIEDNNVYMVGDIKQSIYRFRNADPYIFKNKYDNYSLNNGGYKIDLLKNFRSRNEVLNNINLIFDAIMDDEIGGAKYQESHRMIFGNTSYNEDGYTNQNYDMEIYNYNFEKGLGFTKDEVEIFTIVKDIKEKVESKYKIYDKDNNILRNVTYNDFCILLDRASKFDLYKKIFEYFNVPLTKYTSTNIKQDDEILIIKNILTLLLCIKNNDYDVEFKYSFAAIARSYLLEMDDIVLFDYLNLKTYKESTLYITLLKIVDILPNLSLSKIIEKIIDDFDFYQQSIKVGDMEKVSVRLEYIINLALGMEKMGFGIQEFRDYLERLISSKQKMECEISENISDSVKIMTIHKSKGLEYHICYFAGFDADFNLDDLKDKFLFSEKYGIISPYFKEGIGDTFYKSMFKDDYLKDEISEKIRLFYVALTRCKEKMILVCNLKEEDIYFDSIVDNNIRSKYKSFIDIMNSIKLILKPYIKDINLNDLNLTHDYNLIKKTNYRDSIVTTDEKFNNIELCIDNDLTINKHFSKTNSSLLDSSVKDKMEFGTYIHYLLEVIDFKNPDLDSLEFKYRSYIENFLNSGISFDGNIYKEYEFVYEEENVINHGIIDLMIEYDKSISIIDYKLKNIDDENYYKQLNGYRNYIKNRTKKDVDIYLYSIIDNELKKIDV